MLLKIIAKIIVLIIFLYIKIYKVIKLIGIYFYNNKVNIYKKIIYHFYYN